MSRLGSQSVDTGGRCFSHHAWSSGGLLLVGGDLGWLLDVVCHHCWYVGVSNMVMVMQAANEHGLVE